MEQTRLNVFETNSSSTHAFVVSNEHQIKLFQHLSLMEGNTDDIGKKLGRFICKKLGRFMGNYFNDWSDEYSTTNFIKDLMNDDYIEDIIKDNKLYCDSGNTDGDIITLYGTFENYMKEFYNFNITCSRINDDNFVLNENGILFHIEIERNAEVDDSSSISYVNIQPLSQYKSDLNNILSRINEIESEGDTSC